MHYRCLRRCLVRLLIPYKSWNRRKRWGSPAQKQDSWWTRSNFCISSKIPPWYFVYEIRATECTDKSPEWYAEGEQALGICSIHLYSIDIHDDSEIDDAEVDDHVSEVEWGETDVADDEHEFGERLIASGGRFEGFYFQLFWFLAVWKLFLITHFL